MATDDVLTAPAAPIAPIAPQTSADSYTLHIDDKDTDVTVCVMVPLRTIAEKLGFTVTWNGDKGTILVDNGTMHSEITLGKDSYQVVTSQEELVGMSAPFSLGMAPYATDGTTYVPLQLFEALLGNQEGAITMEDGVITLHTAPMAHDDDDSTQIPNPFSEYESLEQAEQMAGFSLIAPDAINKSTSRIYRAMKDGMLEVVYQNGEDQTARIRKAPGAADISGDYSIYAQVDTVAVGDLQVTMKGENNKVALAIWTDGSYTYAVYADGISNTHMAQLVAGIR